MSAGVISTHLIRLLQGFWLVPAAFPAAHSLTGHRYRGRKGEKRISSHGHVEGKGGDPCWLLDGYCCRRDLQVLPGAKRGESNHAGPWGASLVPEDLLLP